MDVEAIFTKDLVTNATTGLMAIRDLSNVYDVPINIQINDHYINVIVGYGTKYIKNASFYCQDMYRYHSEYDTIYNRVVKMIEERRQDILAVVNKEKKNGKEEMRQDDGDQ